MYATAQEVAHDNTRYRKCCDYIEHRGKLLIRSVDWHLDKNGVCECESKNCTEEFRKVLRLVELNWGTKVRAANIQLVVTERKLRCLSFTKPRKYIGNGFPLCRVCECIGATNRNADWYRKFLTVVLLECLCHTIIFKSLIHQKSL